MKCHLPAGPSDSLRDEMPWAVRAIAALSWLVATLGFVTGGAAWVAPNGEFGDLVFGVTLGGGAAYLGMALTRRVLFAWQVCTRVALATGLINLVAAPTVLVAVWLGRAGWPAPPAGLEGPEKMLLLVLAVLATATPWLAFRALNGERTKRWIGVMGIA